MKNVIPTVENNNKNVLKPGKLDKIIDYKYFANKIGTAKIFKQLTPHKTGNKKFSFKNSSKKHTNFNSLQKSGSTNQSSIESSQKDYLIENKSLNSTETGNDLDISSNQSINVVINNETGINNTILDQTNINSTNSSTNQTALNSTLMNQTCLNNTGNETFNNTTTVVYEDPKETTKGKVTDTLLAIGYASAAIAAACAMNPEPLASKVICAVAVTVAVISFVAVIFCKWLW
jgi:hypothetical protein